MKSFAAVVLILALTAQAPAPVQIVEPGVYHGEELSIEPGDEWWGLFREGKGFVLKKTAIEIELVNDPILDTENEATAKEVSAADADEPPLFLIKGVKGLSARKVECLFDGSENDGFVAPGTFAPYVTEGGKALHVVAVGNAKMDSNEFAIYPVIEDYRLILLDPIVEPPVRQEVARLDSVGVDGRPSVVFAGDIDGDGKPDLLLNLTDHYNVRLLALYLSTAAKKGELIGKVAELKTTGC